MLKPNSYLPIFLIVGLLLIITNCNKHPRDKTNLDDIIHCGFGKEYVSGYTRHDGSEVAGYCRNQN